MLALRRGLTASDLSWIKIVEMIIWDVSYRAWLSSAAVHVGIMDCCLLDGTAIDSPILLERELCGGLVVWIEAGRAR